MIFFLVAGALSASYFLYVKNFTQQVIFYVSNDSRYDLPLVELELSIDGTRIVLDTFRATKVVPDYVSYVERVKKGTRLIEAKSRGKVRVRAEKIIDVSDKPLYVFVSFDYDTLIGKEIETRRMIFYMLNDSTTTKFALDSLVRRKDIIIHVMDKKPIHQ